MPALAITMGSLGIERSGHLPRYLILEQLGEASYSIYLTHFVLLGAVSGPLHHLWAPVAVTLFLILACTVGWIVHRLFERPLVALSKTVMRAIWSQPVSSRRLLATSN
jgi:exopolysaccharide production protein ExoZ